MYDVYQFICVNKGKEEEGEPFLTDTADSIKVSLCTHM